MADFFSPGPIEFYIRTRQQQTFSYLGTCVTAPEITANYYHEDVTSDRTGRVPWQRMKDSEQHVVVATLNRLNWESLNRLRAETTAPTTHKVKVGFLINNVSDFELYIRNSLTDSLRLGGGRFGPDGVWVGRLYYSAVLSELHETSDQNRTKQVSLMIECSPLYFDIDKTKVLYTELPEFLPTVTSE